MCGKLARVVPGGATRADSVKRGLMAIRSATAEIVAVHDGVRPFVTVEEIRLQLLRRRKQMARRYWWRRSLIRSSRLTIEAVVKTLDRGRLRRALTPQCFRYELLREAYQQADVNDPSLTDESALVEQLGKRVSIVEGSARNIKITTAEDLAIAEAILAAD